MQSKARNVMADRKIDKPIPFLRKPLLRKLWGENEERGMQAMKLFSDCSGECCVCSSGGFCLAGHGDDDFSPASKEKIIERLDKAEYPRDKDYMIQYLAKLGYHYDVSNYGKKRK